MDEKKSRTLTVAWNSGLLRTTSDICLAETEGFEPSIQVLPECSLSRGVPSTSRPRLREVCDDSLSILFGQIIQRLNHMGFKPFYLKLPKIFLH